MATFGSRGGLHQIIPVKPKRENNSCLSIKPESCEYKSEPFIDLRKVMDNIEFNKEDDVMPE